MPGDEPDHTPNGPRGRGDPGAEPGRHPGDGGDTGAAATTTGASPRNTRAGMEPEEQGGGGQSYPFGAGPAGGADDPSGEGCSSSGGGPLADHFAAAGAPGGHSTPAGLRSFAGHGGGHQHRDDSSVVSAQSVPIMRHGRGAVQQQQPMMMGGPHGQLMYGGMTPQQSQQMHGMGHQMPVYVDPNMQAMEQQQQQQFADGASVYSHATHATQGTHASLRSAPAYVQQQQGAPYPHQMGQQQQMGFITGGMAPQQFQAQQQPGQFAMGQQNYGMGNPADQQQQVMMGNGGSVAGDTVSLAGSVASRRQQQYAVQSVASSQQQHHHPVVQNRVSFPDDGSIQSVQYYRPSPAYDGGQYGGNCVQIDDRGNVVGDMQPLLEEDEASGSGGSAGGGSWWSAWTGGGGSRSTASSSASPPPRPPPRPVVARGRQTMKKRGPGGSGGGSRSCGKFVVLLCAALKRRRSSLLAVLLLTFLSYKSSTLLLLSAGKTVGSESDKNLKPIRYKERRESAGVMKRWLYSTLHDADVTAHQVEYHQQMTRWVLAMHGSGEPYVHTLKPPGRGGSGPYYAIWTKGGADVLASAWRVLRNGDTEYIDAHSYVSPIGSVREMTHVIDVYGDHAGFHGVSFFCFFVLPCLSSLIWARRPR